MTTCLIIVGSTSHVLSTFKPKQKYDNYLFCNRKRDKPKWCRDRYNCMNYDLSELEANESITKWLGNGYEEIYIIFSSYSSAGLSIDASHKDQIKGLNANCRMPLDLFNQISLQQPNAKVNGIFLSSMYAASSPNHNNYRRKEEQNPLFYGVAKAGVEQGLKWLSCQNKNHRFNGIRLGAMPKDYVTENDPMLIDKLKKQTPSGELVAKYELDCTINYLLEFEGPSLRGCVINLDGGYSLW